MNPSPEGTESVLELEVGRIADEFEALCRQGRAPEIDEFVGRYPHLVDVLRDILPAVQLLQSSSVKCADTEKEPTLSDTSPPLSAPGFALAVVNGAYEILGELGRGGMGIVYKARQVALDRVVALKMIRAGVAASPDEQQRFRREAQTAAQLGHPHIVQIYEVGDSDGQPYFSLEYMDGGSLAAKLNSQPQPPRQAAELVETLARAINAAHQHGLVHRDLKPANILLATDGTPKITDFGLVKRLTDDSLQTQSGAIVGTPSYMAPEQASGKSGTIGPAADIYALGAVLYDVLTGRPPFKAATALETLEQVRHHEPVSPLNLQPTCPRDLETICLKCLSKDPARRYASAADLADDLRRFLAHEPIRARPLGVVERAGKWVRRRPTTATFLAVSTLAILLLAVIGGVSYWRVTDALDEKTKSESDAMLALDKLEKQEAKVKEALTRETRAGEATQRALNDKQKALEKEETARKDLHLALEREKFLRRQDRSVAYLGKIALIQRALEANDVAQADHYLHECPLDLRQWEWHYLKGARFAESLTFRGHDTPVNHIAFSADGRRIASVGGSGGTSTIKVWDAATGEEEFSLPFALTVHNVAVSGNGQWLAAAASAQKNEPGWLKVWHAQKRTEIKAWTLKNYVRLRVTFTADSRYLITETDLEVQYVDTTTWKSEVKIQFPGITGAKAAFLPDGSMFAYDKREKSADGKNRWTLRLRGKHSEKEQVFPAHDKQLRALALSQDGKYVAAGDTVGTIFVWDVTSGKEMHCLFGHVSSVFSLAFSPDHKYLVSSSLDRTVKVWHVQTGQLAFTIRGHAGSVRAVAFQPDGQRLATASDDRTVKLWSMGTKGPIDVVAPNHAGGDYTTLAFHPHGQLAMATRDGTIIVRQVMGQKERRLDGPKGHWQQLAYSTDALILAAAGVADRDGPVSIVQTWDSEGNPRIAFRGHEAEDRARRGKRLSACVALGSKDQLAASATRDDFGTAPFTVKVWDRVTGAERFTYRGHEASVVAVAFSPDGTRVASADWSFQTQRGRLKVWNVKDGKDIFTQEGFFGQHAQGLAFSPDGMVLAACAGKNVLLLDGQTGVPLRTLTAHSAQVLGVDFTADSQRLLTVSLDRTAKLWDVFTGREALTLRLGAEQAFVLARFSPDQQSLAALAVDGERRFVKLWPAPLEREPMVLGGESLPMKSLQFSPDGRWLFAKWKDFKAWNLETNREEYREESRLPSLNLVGVLYDRQGHRCAGVYFDGPSAHVKILDLTARLDPLTLCQNKKYIHSLVFSPDGQRLAVALLDYPPPRSTIKLCDPRTGQELISCVGHSGIIRTMAFSDDGQRLFSVSSTTKNKGEIKTWNTTTGREVQSHSLQTDEFFPALFSPDLRYLATNGGTTLEGEAKLWEVASGRLLATIPLPRRGRGLAFSPDGKHLAIVSAVMKDSRLSGIVQVLEVPACKEVLSLLDAGTELSGVHFHPQGRWLVTGGYHVKIWDLKAWQR